MHLNEPLLRLPLRFDADALAAEVNALPDAAWVPHPNKLPGNEAVRLVTPHGEMTEGVAGAMAATEYLVACPYMIEVMAAIGAVWGRGRLMRLAPGAVVPAHIDTNYYWRKHIRIHIPITTSPDVLFTCGGRSVHMAAGDCWVFDTFSVHHVRNAGTQARVHLVADTVGGERLWDLIDEAQTANLDPAAASPRFLEPGTGKATNLTFERENDSTIISPWELQCHVGFIAEQTPPAPGVTSVMKRLDRFVAGWTGAWAQFGPTEQGIPIYQLLISRLETDLLEIGGDKLMLRNKLPLYRQIAELLFTVSSSLSMQTQPATSAPMTRDAQRIGRFMP